MTSALSVEPPLPRSSPSPAFAARLAHLRRRHAPAPHLVAMALIFLGAIVVGYLLLPDDNERIAMLERDGQDRQALQILEQRFAAGDRRDRTLFQLQSLYEEKGDLVRARATLELLAARRPGDGNLLRDLGELYRVTQDEAGYVRTLESRLELRFSQPVCKELIGLYRRAGNFVSEQRVLAHCVHRGYRRTDDIVRLAHLIAVDGQLAEAAGLLRSVDDRRLLKADSDRIMLFSALLESGGAEEAKRRAVRWFKGSRDASLVLQMINTLTADNRHELAIDLAREVGRQGDSVSLAVAELMLDRNERVAARIYLSGWVDQASLGDLDLAQRALRAALEAEDARLAHLIATKTGLPRLPQGDLVTLAEALSAIGDTAAFETVRGAIPAEALRENILLAAAVEVDQGKAEPARQLLSRIQVKALDEWRLALWARLMASTERRATARETRREIQTELRAPAPGRAGPLGLKPIGGLTPIPRPGAADGPAIPGEARKGPPRRTVGLAQPGDPATGQKASRRPRSKSEKRVPRRARAKASGAPSVPKTPSLFAPSPFSFPQ